MLAYLVTTLGLFLIVMNWAIAYRTHVKGEHSSGVPLLGGLFLAIGVANTPFEALHPYIWSAFVLDYGCLPLLLHIIWHQVMGKHR